MNGKANSKFPSIEEQRCVIPVALGRVFIMHTRCISSNTHRPFQRGHNRAWQSSRNTSKSHVNVVHQLTVVEFAKAP